MEPNFTHSIMVMIAFMAAKGFNRTLMKRVLYHLCNEEHPETKEKNSDYEACIKILDKVQEIQEDLDIR